MTTQKMDNISNIALSNYFEESSTTINHIKEDINTIKRMAIGKTELNMLLDTSILLKKYKMVEGCIC